MPNYQCPKCGGTDFFMSKRNVMKGMGNFGLGNRGGVKEFPVCRVCDEIMSYAAPALPAPPLGKFDRMSKLKKVLLVVAVIVGYMLILNLMALLGSLFGS
jgi:hypothetical protein